MADWHPPHAYIPGQTPRHPEDLFDSIKVTANGISVRDIPACQAWRSGLQFLEAGFFWEAHEVLEAVWLACPPNSAEKLMVQAVIQSANARLKAVMGREAAAERLRRVSKRLAEEAILRAGGPVLYVDTSIVYYNAL